MAATPRYRKDRRAWYVYFEHRGKRWAEKVGGSGAEQEARAVADSWNQKMAAKDERAAMLHRGAPAPFRVIAEAWWDAKEPGMPRSSRVSKRCVVYERLIPHFGDREIRRFDEDLVRGCAVAMATKRNHARETVETTGSVLDTILRWAWKKGVLDEMPVPRERDDKNIRAIFRETAAALCRPPQPIEAWSQAEVGFLLGEAQNRGSWLFDPILFFSQTGCRRGELIALEWVDVDLPRGRATLRQSETRGQTKTTKADNRRTVDLSSAAVEMLKRRAWEQFRETPFEQVENPGRVFRDPDGNPWKDHSISGYWLRIRRTAHAKYGVRPLKLHCWRHTWATWALASGEDVAWCAKQIGDTLDVFLKRYAHAMPGTKRSLDFLNVTPHVAGSSEASGEGAAANSPRGRHRSR